MKKRMIALLLMLVLLVTFVFPSTLQTAQAANEGNVMFNAWVMPDLIVGETYGIFPATWTEKGLTGAITQGQLRILMAGIRNKILDTECATETGGSILTIDNSITVEEVLNTCFKVLSNYNYTADLGLGSLPKPIEYMKQHGIYTGLNGEQALKDICSIEQAIAIATRIITYVYDTLDAASKGFLWEVKSGENTVYLLGSIHIASYSIYPFSNTMLAAYQSADALLVEANFYDQADLAGLNQLTNYNDGTTLKDHVSTETYQKSIETAALLGIPEATVAMLKPWALYFTFDSYASAGNSQNDQIVPSLGIDMMFLTNAAIFQKPIYVLEGFTKQGMILNSMSAELQEYLLNSTIESVKEVFNATAGDDLMDQNELLDLLLQNWHDGDVESFMKLTVIDEAESTKTKLTDKEKEYMKEHQDKLLTQRDKGMAEKIDSLLKAEGSSTYFVVAGSSHYISDHSIIDILKEKGYEINQVK